MFGAYYGVTNVMSPIITRRNFGDVDYPRNYSRISTGASVANMLGAFIWGAVIDATGGLDVVFVGITATLVVIIVLVVLIKRIVARDSLQAEGA